MTTLSLLALIAKGDPWHSSCRTAEEVGRIFEEVNEIWKQADVRFDAQVFEWRFDPKGLDEMVQAAFRRMDDADSVAEVRGYDRGQIMAIYVHSVGGASGKVFRPKKTIIVVDDTKVSASRTTAHEIGHIFDLEHWLERPPPAPPDRPPSQLMARTQDGTELLPRDIEQVTSRLPTSGLRVLG